MRTALLAQAKILDTHIVGGGTSTNLAPEVYEAVRALRAAFLQLVTDEQERTALEKVIPAITPGMSTASVGLVCRQIAGALMTKSN
jgi:hypothetical protein